MLDKQVDFEKQKLLVYEDLKKNKKNRAVNCKTEEKGDKQADRKIIPPDARFTFS